MRSDAIARALRAALARASTRTTTKTSREFVGDGDIARFFEDGGDDDGASAGVGVGRGRVDVMGGIADYSGATVAQLGLGGRRTECRARFRDAASGTSGTFRARTVTIGTRGAEEEDARCFEARFDEVFDAETFDAGKTREYFERTPSAANERWAAYVAGAMGEFLRAISSDADASMKRARAWVEKLARCDCEIEIRSDVPQGKGVASSAAVEIAVARAVAASALRAGVVSEDDAARRFSAHVAMIPLYCQTAENDVVGAPCGFMDQYACFHSVDSASRGNFIAIDCDLANTSHDGAEDIYRLVPLPRKLRVWGIDSGVRHSNSGGSDYARVRCGTFMGKKILINEMNARLNRDVVPSKVDLCGVITARQWDEGSAGSPMSWSQHVDKEMTGKSFLARYISHDDEPNTTIDADSTYTLRATVSHAVREHARVREFLSILEDWPSDDVCADDDVRQLGRRLGDLMFASHSSYSSVGLGSTATDDLVRLVREVDVERNALFGAKITGGGSGGVVCVLGEDSPSARAAIDAVRREYAKKHSLTNLPDLLHASHVTDVD